MFSVTIFQLPYWPTLTYFFGGGRVRSIVFGGGRSFPAVLITFKGAVRALHLKPFRCWCGVARGAFDYKFGEGGLMVGSFWRHLTERISRAEPRVDLFVPVDLRCVIASLLRL
jgi:hypothetical protein